MHVLITAGPTREPIDPVRFLSNRSSGKMGYALAQAALDAGHRVTLVSGPVHLLPPPAAELHVVQTAQQMWQTVRNIVTLHPPSLAILSAAVADYRPKFLQPEKIKKNADTITLELERTPDILGSMRQPFGYQGYLAGFAAETQNLIHHAQTKLNRKQCDVIIANDVSRNDTGFDSDQNEVILCFPGDHVEAVPMQSKHDLATLLIQRLVNLAIEKSPSPPS